MDRENCAHENFEANVAVGRLVENDGDTDPHAFVANVTVRCADCGEPFLWRGLPYGVETEKPCVSLSGAEARLPIWSETHAKLAGQGPLLAIKPWKDVPEWYGDPRSNR